jgi:hypothetical protein
MAIERSVLQMKKLATIGFCLAGLAAAQTATKISGTGKCGQPEKQEVVEVGDRAGHSLVLIKGTCAWTTPIEMAGAKAKSYTVTLTSDVNGGKGTDRGYVVITMDNGDKAFVRITQGNATLGKDGKPESGEGAWVYTGGTGKLKGLKGKGTYKSKSTADGGEDTVEGEYTLPAGKS